MIESGASLKRSDVVAGINFPLIYKNINNIFYNHISAI
jgi:hypothetical protein